jgi:general secretion pathway protein M
VTAARPGLAAIEPYWRHARIWWTGRSPREQVLIGVLIALAIGATVLLGVIAPLRSVRADALADIRSAALLEARLRAGGADLARRGLSRRGTPSAIVTDSAAAAGLTIQQIETEGGQTRVVVADAPFERVLQWIADMERTSRLRVNSLEVSRKDSPGIVATTLVLG